MPESLMKRPQGPGRLAPGKHKSTFLKIRVHEVGFLLVSLILRSLQMLKPHAGSRLANLREMVF